MNFNIFKNFGKAGTIAARMMTSGLVLMFAICTMTFINSVQAQTPQVSTPSVKQEAERKAVPALVEALEQEISYLREDMKSTGINARKNSPTLLGASWHKVVIDGYTLIANNIRDGHGVQQQMLNFLQGPAYNNSDDGAVKAKIVLNSQQKQQLNNITNFVRTWNINERDISDFTQTLMMIRELKN